MLYMIMVRDQAESEAARQQHRDGHLAHFAAHKSRIALAGPLNDDDGRSVGSLVIYDTESEAAARAFIRADPFYDAGVWQGPVIASFKGSIFAPEKFA